MDGNDFAQRISAGTDTVRSVSATQRIPGNRDPCFQSAAQRYLLLGICGSGMRAICEMLLEAGHSVAASDSQLIHGSDAVAEHFRWKNPRIQILPWDAALHESSNVSVLGSSHAPVHAVIASNAVPEHDARITASRRAGFPVFRLTQALSQLLAGHPQLCVAGTHGKTTTTAMLWTVLSRGRLASSAFIGGELVENQRSGFLRAIGRAVESTRAWAVVESCEYRNAFSNLQPAGLILTGIERDHFDCFPDMESEDQVFLRFAQKLPSGGFLIVNADCPRAMQVAARTGANAGIRVTRFSLSGEGDWTADRIHVERSGVQFRARWRGQTEGEIRLQVPGHHNVRNALAVVAAAAELGMPFETVSGCLSEFRGVCRRFEDRGEWRGMQLIDDYAHHPTAISATLSTARSQFANRRIIAVFEPHQISRVEQLFDEFGKSLQLADECLVLPVLPARETSTRTLCCQTSGRLVRSINLAGGRAFLLADLDQVIGRIDHAGRPGDVVITMGAGRTNQIHDEFHRRLQRDFVA